MMEPTSWTNSKKHCLGCGASWRENALQCWLCSGTESGTRAINPYAVSAELIQEEPSRRSGFDANDWTLRFGIAAVVLGLAIVSPGLAILAAICIAPAVTRSARIMRRRSQEGGPPLTRLQRAGILASSMAVSMVIAATAGIAALGTFCVVCLGTLQMQTARNDALALTVSSVAALSVLGGIFVLLRRWTERDL